MNSRNRWVLLEHIDAPGDDFGRHFDLLFEDGICCRAWKMNAIPVLDGPAIQIVPSSPHSLDWLETSGRLVSKNRGWAKPLMRGFFLGSLPDEPTDSFSAELYDTDLIGILKIADQHCSLRKIP